MTIYNMLMLDSRFGDLTDAEKAADLERVSNAWDLAEFLLDGADPMVADPFGFCFHMEPPEVWEGSDDYWTWGMTHPSLDYEPQSFLELMKGWDGEVDWDDL